MKPNYYQIFRYKLAEEEVKTPVETESNLDKILRKSKRITSVLTQLMTTQKKVNQEAKDQLKEVISDIKCISYKPTTFRVVIPNGNYFDLKYDPTPLELQYPNDYEPKDSFTVIVSGKRFNIANNSELESSMEYINKLLSTKPIGKAPEEAPEPGEAPKTGPEAPVEPGEEEAPETTPEETT
jgi:hypothetical protein